MKFRCDLCDKQIEFDQGAIVYDLLIEKKRFYCRECEHDYKQAVDCLSKPEPLLGFGRMILQAIKNKSLDS